MCVRACVHVCACVCVRERESANARKGLKSKEGLNSFWALLSDDERMLLLLLLGRWHTRKYHFPPLRTILFLLFHKNWVIIFCTYKHWVAFYEELTLLTKTGSLKTLLQCVKLILKQDVATRLFFKTCLIS